MNDLRDPVVDVGHSIIYGKHLFRDPLYPLVYSMRSPQVFRSGHLPFLLCQPVQPLQRIFRISLSDQPPPILF
jgi:hypothetical protein